MSGDRVEVRLDATRRSRLDAIATSRGQSVSELVRQLIDDAYVEVQERRRRQAAARLIELELEDVPDPEELRRQLVATHAGPPHSRR